MRKEKADITAVFRRVVASIPYQQNDGDKLQGKAWRWAEGVHVFPEAICPMCNGVMQSNCLWKLDERGQRVVQVVGIKSATKLVELPVKHPHVYSGSNMVCMGSSRTRSVAQAVFMGMTVLDCMGDFSFDASRDAPTWVKFFDTYFTGHIHAEKRKRRPSLKLAAVRKAATARTVRTKRM